jgi:hypothetical protein
MSYQQAQPSISLIVFKNKYKQKPLHPDMTGTLKFPDGRELEISLWNKVSETTGEEFLAGNAKEKWVKPEGYVSKAQPRTQDNRVKIDF